MNSFVLLLCLSNNNNKKNSNLTNFPSPIGHILAQWISFLSESELCSQMIFGLLFGPRCIMLILLFAECFLYAYQRLIRSSPRNLTLNSGYYSSRPLREAEHSRPTISPYSQRWSQDSHSGLWGADPRRLSLSILFYQLEGSCNDWGMLPSLLLFGQRFK